MHGGHGQAYGKPGHGQAYGKAGHAVPAGYMGYSGGHMKVGKNGKVKMSKS